MKKIYIILIIILILVGFTITLLLLILNGMGVINLEELNPFEPLKDEDDSYVSESGEAIVKTCEEIAQFYKALMYHYDKESCLWNINYKEQIYNGSCCSIYVMQVMHVHGLKDDLGDYDCAYLDRWLSSHRNDWDRFVFTSERDLRKGDINIYLNGGSHVNIFAGLNKLRTTENIGMLEKEEQELLLEQQKPEEENWETNIHVHIV